MVSPFCQEDICISEKLEADKIESVGKVKTTFYILRDGKGDSKLLKDH